MQKINLALLLVQMMFPIGLFAAEESLDLQKEAEPTPPPSHSTAHGGSSLKLMGRIDLTNEITAYESPKSIENDKLKSYHFLVFLKAQPSPKVSFMGEIVRQSFYEATYAMTDQYRFHFGKIVVPFGDTRRFHHFYGGIQGYGAQGVMFPNVWAENGLNFESRFEAVDLEFYVTSGITSTAENIDPDFRVDSTDKRQAAGLRATTDSLLSNWTFIGSVYYDEWWPSHPLYLLGLDAVAGYKFLPGNFLGGIRLSMGRAQAEVKKGTLGDYQKAGDYIELATNHIQPGEFRIRYGTYIDNSKNKTVNDVHNINAGYSFPIDVLRLLTEYQWNYEAVDEVQNDVFRMMLSLDF
ncbi:MAG: hypothetical protein ABL958_11310 [Bdellovibrionia bacterium]